VHHLCFNRECVNAGQHLVILTRPDHAKLHAFLRARRRKGTTDEVLTAAPED
jgi:hypothetical protein